MRKRKRACVLITAEIMNNLLQNEFDIDNIAITGINYDPARETFKVYINSDDLPEEYLTPEGYEPRNIALKGNDNAISRRI